MLPQYIDFSFSRTRQQAYKAGLVHERWLATYPELFDEDDARIVANQHSQGSHFYEMLCAIVLLETTGYVSMMEKYSSHSRKRQKLEAIVPTNMIEKFFRNTGGEPDLFCYHPDTKDWFLAEVKGPGDRLGGNQKLWIEQFEAFSGNRVWIIRVREYSTDDR
ncbi:MAG: VRR-NUC domain-containing protein [Pseudomonadota bacterium]